MVLYPVVIDVDHQAMDARDLMVCYLHAFRRCPLWDQMRQDLDALLSLTGKRYRLVLGPYQPTEGVPVDLMVKWGGVHQVWLGRATLPCLMAEAEWKLCEV